MTDYKEIPLIMREIPLNTIQRIDLGLEGNWNPTVVTVWSRKQRVIGFPKAILSHPDYKPSLELYFEGSWLGIHCFNRIDDQNVFDEEFATIIIKYVESRC